MEYSNYIPKGYYILDYSLAFKYDNSGNFGIITPSSFHNIIDYQYSDILDVENNPVQFSYNIERTNSYLTGTYGGVETFVLANQKMIHIKHNTDDLKIRFKTVEFDGKVEPLVVTGTNAGTYIIEVIPQGLSNCPDVKFETTSFRAELFRIF
jgi:hypothetical protein